MIFNGLSDVNFGSGVQIATGSYVGTGTYGASNKVVLTLPFPAKAIFVNIVPVTSGSGDNDYYEIMLIKGNQNKEYLSSSKYFAMDAGSARGNLIYVTFDDNQNTVKWYSPNSANAQLNIKNFTYNYIAFGGSGVTEQPTPEPEPEPQITFEDGFFTENQEAQCNFNEDKIDIVSDGEVGGLIAITLNPGAITSNVMSNVTYTQAFDVKGTTYEEGTTTTTKLVYMNGGQNTDTLTFRLDYAKGNIVLGVPPL